MKLNDFCKLFNFKVEFFESNKNYNDIGEEFVIDRISAVSSSEDTFDNFIPIRKGFVGTIIFADLFLISELKFKKENKTKNLGSNDIYFLAIEFIRSMEIELIKNLPYEFTRIILKKNYS